ncbi:MAG TPA: nuclease-related domain-containing protein [Candidatus Limnocylindrales bacterium]|nr:nuclease-related domain-containing protein [Candidatus Limnocylindrales bacterium]
MQVIASARPAAGRPSRLSVLSSFVLGAVCVSGAAAIVIAVFGLGFLERFVPSGHASTFQLVSGALAWAFALTAPAGFGLVGVTRLVTSIERARARRPRITPAVRLARAIGDDHVVATNVRIPDGSRIVPELVIGPFGAAVIEELPPATAVMSHGVRSWEVRTGDGRVQTIENPLERASRDAERVRAWLSSEESDHVIKVYAAVVGTDPRVERSQACAVIGPEQVAGWLTSLAPQATLDEGRRDRIVRTIRSAL